MQNGLLNIVLKHFRGRTNEKNKDVTTLDWNVSFHMIFVYSSKLIFILLSYSMLMSSSACLYKGMESS